MRIIGDLTCYRLAFSFTLLLLLTTVLVVVQLYVVRCRANLLRLYYS